MSVFDELRKKFLKKHDNTGKTVPSNYSNNNVNNIPQIMDELKIDLKTNNGFTKKPESCNKNLTEMVFILDRSGSMSNLVMDTIGGYNGMIEKQKQEEGEATVTTVLFDTDFDVLCENVDIHKVEKLTNKTYYARGCTALLDAVGKTINMVSNRHANTSKNEVPGKTIVIITTDGMENASREYNKETVKAMIENQKKMLGWEFIFIGANIDAVSVAKSIGIGAERAANYHADSRGTKKNFEAINNVCRAYRKNNEIDEGWKKAIDDDFKSRNRD